MEKISSDVLPQPDTVVRLRRKFTRLVSIGECPYTLKDSEGAGGNPRGTLTLKWSRVSRAKRNKMEVLEKKKKTQQTSLLEHIKNSPKWSSEECQFTMKIHNENF